MKKQLLLIVLILVNSFVFGQDAKDVAHWNKIKESDKYSDFIEYKQLYPEGSFLKKADEKIKKITEKEIREWGKAKKTNSVKGYNAFLNLPPQIDSLKTLATNAITELERTEKNDGKVLSAIERDWQEALTVNTEKGFEKFKEQHKNNAEHIKKADEEIKKLKKSNPLLYPFIILLLLLVGVVFLLFKVFKKMNKINSKFHESKISLSENIEKYKDSINSINSMLKSLGKTEQLSTQITKSENIEKMDTLLAKIDAEFTSISKQAKALENEYKNNVQLLNKIEEETQVSPNQLANLYKEAKIELLEKEKEIASLKQSANNGNDDKILPLEIPKDTYINSNILVSAGPRKDKDNDTELGEDATGILNTPTGTYFWILDGTSDSPSIISENEHIFSSRILAQTMNNEIKNLLAIQNNQKFSLKDILINAVDNSKKILFERIKSSSNELHNKIVTAIKSGNNPYCSTTVLLGFLSKSGELNYFYLGDSEVISFQNNGNQLIANTKDVNENPSRLFISIIIEDNAMKFRTNPFDEKLVSFSKNNVDYMIAFSDGIGVSEKSILTNPQLEISKISMTNQKTYDDKSLIVIERVKYK